MKDYLVTAHSVQITDGTVRLTAAQSGTRAHLLEKVKGDTWRIVSPITFKRGERFGLDGEVSKTLLESIAAPEGVTLDLAAQ